MVVNFENIKGILKNHEIMRFQPDIDMRYSTRWGMSVLQISYMADDRKITHRWPCPDILNEHDFIVELRRAVNKFKLTEV